MLFSLSLSLRALCCVLVTLAADCEKSGICLPLSLSIYGRQASRMNYIACGGAVAMAVRELDALQLYMQLQYLLHSTIADSSLSYQTDHPSTHILQVL